MFATVRELASLIQKNPSIGAEGPYGYLHLDDCGDGTVPADALLGSCPDLASPPSLIYRYASHPGTGVRT
jgi:hypothetical protein